MFDTGLSLEYLQLEFHKSHIIDLLNMKIGFYKREEEKRLRQEKMMEEYIKNRTPSLMKFWSSKAKVRKSLEEAFYNETKIYNRLGNKSYTPIRYHGSFNNIIDLLNNQKIALTKSKNNIITLYVNEYVGLLNFHIGEQ